MGNACSDNQNIPINYDARTLILQPNITQNHIQPHPPLSATYNDVARRYPKTQDPQIHSSYIRDKLTELGAFVPQRPFDAGTLHPPHIINKQGAVYVGEWKNS